MKGFWVGEKVYIKQRQAGRINRLASRGNIMDCGSREGGGENGKKSEHVRNHANSILKGSRYAMEIISTTLCAKGKGQKRKGRLLHCQAVTTRKEREEFKKKGDPIEKTDIMYQSRRS